MNLSLVRSGPRSRGSVSAGRDAEFFPLRSRRDSSASRCSTKTHEEETKTIVSDYQRTDSDRRINTVRSRSSEAGQRSTSGGEDHFHTSEKKLAGKISSVKTLQVINHFSCSSSSAQLITNCNNQTVSVIKDEETTRRHF